MTSFLSRWFGRRQRPLTAPLAPTESEQPAILTLTDSTFAATVLSAEQPVVVDFWAEWCQPCQIIAAYVGFLAKDFGEQIIVAALDVDENTETPATYAIMGLPTLLIFKAGIVVERIVGIEPYETIRAKVAAHL